ncbi:MAG TPA: YfhO family protein [Pirellulales bacterium]|nr:YfhO family protein [Pirellulales bacterium]
MAPFAALLAGDERVVGGWNAFDVACYQIPVQQFARDEILAGRLPLWLPYLGCGTPLHASQQAALSYPLLMPFVLAAGANDGIKLSLFLHLAICFTGQYLLARQLDVSPPAASFAALVATWSVFLVDHLLVGHITLVFGYPLTAWFLLALARFIRAPGARSCAALAGVTALFALVGHPQMLYYALLAGATWMLFSLAVGEGAVHRRRLVVWLAVGATCALLTASIQWLPGAELARGGLGGTGRGTLAYAGLFAMDGGDFARLVVPFFKGDRLEGLRELASDGLLHERAGYVGLITIALAYAGLRRATAARWQHFAAWLLPLALVIGLGNGTPLLGFAGKVLPGLLWFRCQGRALALASVLLPLMAARGLDAVVRADAPASRRGRWSARLAACCTVVLVGYFAADWLEQVGWRRYMAFARENLGGRYAEFAVIVAASGGSFIAARRWGQRWPMEMYSVVLMLAVVDLGSNSAGRFSLDAVVPETMAPRIAAVGPRVRFARAPNWPKVSRVALQFSSVAPMALAARRSAINTNDGGVLPEALDRLYSAIERHPDTVLPLSGCQYVTPSPGSWRQVRGRLPRIRFIGSQAAHLCSLPIEESDEQTLAALRDGLSPNVRVLDETPRGLLVETTSARKGMLVVADTYYPGWTCMVDGDPVAIQAAHGVFRGVPLSAGRHLVEFAYVPRSFYCGLICSVCGVSLIAVLAVLRKP